MCVIGSNAYAGRVANARKKTQGTMNRGMAAALLRDIIMLLRPNPVRIRHPKLPPAEQTSVHGVRARTDHDKRRSNAVQEPVHSETPEQPRRVGEERPSCRCQGSRCDRG